MGKKNRKAMARKKAQPRKKKKKNIQSDRTPRSLRPRPDAFIGRPSMADIEAPEGFRAIGMAQAMMAYIAPLMESIEEGDTDRLNEVMQVGMTIWNYTISQEKKLLPGPSKAEMLLQIQNILNRSPPEASDLLERMVKRKTHLFPSDIQPDYPMIMFIRKEESHQIDPFDYDVLTLSEDPAPPDDEDRELIEVLHRMDRYITDGADYGEWEDHFFSLKENCCKRFYRWLAHKGAKDYSEDFSGCVEIYLDFIYAYAHPDIVTLKQVSASCIEGFFADYLLRKITVEPHEYTHWPPALKLFYTFLREKGYLGDSKPAIKLLDAFEPRFIDILRKIYA